MFISLQDTGEFRSLITFSFYLANRILRRQAIEVVWDNILSLILVAGALFVDQGGSLMGFSVVIVAIISLYFELFSILL